MKREGNREWEEIMKKSICHGTSCILALFILLTEITLASIPKFLQSERVVRISLAGVLSLEP